MIKLLGLFFILIGVNGLEYRFNLNSLGLCVLGLFMVCSKEFFGHLLFIEREKVRSHYRRRR